MGYLTWLRYVSEKAWVWRRVSLLVVRLGGGGGYVGYLTWLRNVSEKAWVWRRVSLLVVRLG